MKKEMILLALLVLTGCSPPQYAAEQERERVRARMLAQEVNQNAAQMRRYAEARLRQMGRLRVIVREQVRLAEQAQEYRWEIKRLIEQAREGNPNERRVQEIVPALDRIAAQMLERTQETVRLTEQLDESRRELDRLSSDIGQGMQQLMTNWAATEVSTWTLQRGRELILETQVLSDRTQEVRQEIELLMGQFGEIQRELDQEPLQELIQELERLSV